MPTMLPATPKSFGDIRLVFSSALAAVKGERNPLNLPPANQVVSILVDGLGSSNIKARAGHAPFLNSMLTKYGSISAGFPTTTATSITSFATGESPSRHGVVGYRIREPRTQTELNFLRWGSQWDVADFSAVPPISTLSQAAGISTYVVGASDYAASPFTKLTMPDAKYIPAGSITEAFDMAATLMQRQEKSLTYLYVPYLDQTAHAFGWQSSKWASLLEELDSALVNFSKVLKPGQAATLIADHGVIDVDPARHVYLDEIDALDNQVDFVGGDTRALMLYLKPSADKDAIAQSLQHNLRSAAYVLTQNELLATGWYGDLPDKFATRLGDITVLARSQVAFYHREFASANSLKMIGHHGALSSEELMVPLLKFGQFA